jgi:hypothetical protein
MASNVQDIVKIEYTLFIPTRLKKTYKLEPTDWNIAESGIKHHNPNPIDLTIAIYRYQ